MVFEYFKDKVYCTEHKVTFLKGSQCPTCVSCGTARPLKEVQSILTNNSLTNTNNSRRVYVRKNIVERFHAYRVKFEAEVEWSHLFSYEEFTLNNNVKFKRIDFPEAIVRVFRKSILITIRSSKEVKGLPVKEAQRISNDLVLSVLQKLPKAIVIKESKLSSVHNAFINHPLAKRNISVKVNDEVRFISDNSKGNPEFEAINTNHAISDSEAIEQDIISLVDKGLTRDFLAQSLNTLIQDREYYAENLKSHVQAIQDLSKGVNELREQIKLKAKLDFIERFK
jgi:hypothetical protein